MADRHEEELAREMIRRGYTRRQILKLGLGLGLSATGLSTLLAACGGNVSPQTSDGQQAAGTEAAVAEPTTAEAAVPTDEVQFSEEEGAGGPWPSGGVADPGSKVEISVAHAWDASFWPRQQQFDKLFMERHPNIVVTAENTPWGEFRTKYLAQAAGGSLPDLMYIHFSWAQQLIKEGTIVELDGYIAQQSDFNIEDFTKPSWTSYMRDGKRYGIAYDEGPGMLYFNKDIFDKAGVEYPTNDWTLDDLKAAAKKLTSGEGPTKIFGFANTPTPADSAVGPPYLWPFGADYVSEPAEDKCLVNSEKAVKAFEWWMEMRFVDKSVPSPADVQTVQGDPFTFGRVAMMLNGSWATPPLNQNAKFKWDVVNWPKGPEKHSTWSLGSCYSISKDSKNPEAAWIYLNDYISTAGQTFMWASSGRGSPSRNSAWPAYVESKFSPDGAKYMQDAMNTIASHDVLDQPTAPKVGETAGPIWDLVVNEQLGVKEALDQICAAIDPILAQNKA